MRSRAGGIILRWSTGAGFARGGFKWWDRWREGGQNEIGSGMVVGEVVDTDGVECHLVRRLDEGEVLMRSWMEAGGGMKWGRMVFGMEFDEVVDFAVGWNGV